MFKLRSFDCLYNHIVLSRGMDVYKWKEDIERYTLQHRIGIKREMQDLDSVAIKIGINPKAFDNRPYGEFLDALHNRLQIIETAA